MARRSLLRDSWEETREFFSGHARATAWAVTALVLVVIAAAVAMTREDNSGDQTTLRADEQAASVSSPTTFFGNDIIANPNRESRDRAATGAASPDPTAGTLRNGGGLHLYTGTVPDYSGGRKTTTTARGDDAPNPGGSGGSGGSGGGGGSDGGDTPPTSFPAAVFGANRIAYVTNGQAWTANPDGSDPRFVANRAYYPAWAPSHTAIAVVDGMNPGGMLSYITPAGGRYAMTPAPNGDGEGDSRPTWSPDGQRIAFGRIDFGGSGGYSSIWVINKDGQNLKRITVAGCFSADPSWSPDSTHIAFWSSRDHCSSGDPIGATELYVMNSNGSNVQRLATGYNAEAPAFSPDGTRLAYATDRDGNYEIYVANADGTNPIRLTNAAGKDTDPTWSPDGSRIAFSRNNTIYTMKPDGTDVRTVVAGSQPSWS